MSELEVYEKVRADGSSELYVALYELTVEGRDGRPHLQVACLRVAQGSELVRVNASTLRNGSREHYKRRI